jgi:L-2-hydroxycarboxylate dehydrogenase (NAD+)
MGGHKGYSLASMVDILCCVLSGANWGPFAPPLLSDKKSCAQSGQRHRSFFFGALQIDAFIDKGEFKKQIDD